MNKAPVHEWPKDQILDFCLKYKSPNKSEAEARSFWNDRYAVLLTNNTLHMLCDAINELLKDGNTIDNPGAFLNSRSQPYQHVTSSKETKPARFEHITPMPNLGYPKPMLLETYDAYHNVLPGEVDNLKLGMEKPGFPTAEIAEMCVEVIRAYGESMTALEIQNLRIKWYWRVKTTSENPYDLAGITPLLTTLNNIKHGKMRRLDNPSALFMTLTQKGDTR